MCKKAYEFIASGKLSLLKHLHEIWCCICLWKLAPLCNDNSRSFRLLELINLQVEQLVDLKANDKRINKRSVEDVFNLIHVNWHQKKLPTQTRIELMYFCRKYSFYQLCSYVQFSACWRYLDSICQSVKIFITKRFQFHVFRPFWQAFPHPIPNVRNVSILENIDVYKMSTNNNNLMKSEELKFPTCCK